MNRRAKPPEMPGGKRVDDGDIDGKASTETPALD